MTVNHFYIPSRSTAAADSVSSASVRPPPLGPPHRRSQARIIMMGIRKPRGEEERRKRDLGPLSRLLPPSPLPLRKRTGYPLLLLFLLHLVAMRPLPIQAESLHHAALCSVLSACPVWSIVVVHASAFQNLNGSTDARWVRCACVRARVWDEENYSRPGDKKLARGLPE